MGYYSDVNGSFTISTKDGSAISPVDFVLAVKATDEMEYLLPDLDRCVPMDNYEPAITLGVYSNGKWYHLLDNIEDFAEALKEKNLVLDGYVYRVGEEQPDVEKIVIKDNKVVAYKGFISFDDGTTWRR